jgi:putative membrane protein
MGYGDDYGMGAGGWVAMAIFWIAVITLIVWSVSRFSSTGGSGRTESTQPRGALENATGSAEDILDRRFAAGELDEETYRSMCATLRSSGSESR